MSHGIVETPYGIAFSLPLLAPLLCADLEQGRAYGAAPSSLPGHLREMTYMRTVAVLCMHVGVILRPVTRGTISVCRSGAGRSAWAW